MTAQYSAFGFSAGNTMDFGAEVDLTTDDNKEHLKAILKEIYKLLIASKGGAVESVEMMYLVISFFDRDRWQNSMTVISEKMKELMDSLILTSNFKHGGAKLKGGIALIAKLDIDLEVSFALTVNQPIYKGKAEDGVHDFESFDEEKDKQKFFGEKLYSNQYKTNIPNQKIVELFCYNPIDSGITHLLYPAKKAGKDLFKLKYFI